MPGNPNIGPLSEYLMYENSHISAKLIRITATHRTARTLLIEENQRAQERLWDSEDRVAALMQEMHNLTVRYQQMRSYAMQLERRLMASAPGARIGLAMQLEASFEDAADQSEGDTEPDTEMSGEE